MPIPANVSDIVARFRPLSDLEIINAQAFLEDAWELMQTRRPTIEADMAAETVREGNVIRVLVNMVLRVLRNPEGKISESIDDYSYTRDNTAASGVLMIFDDELDDITPVAFTTALRNSVRLVRHGEIWPK